MHVLIVGAGLAGLGAGWRLTQAGHEVSVYEARDRVGGRTWSHRLDNGAVVERGGEFVDVYQHTIRRVCGELGLPLVPHGVNFYRRENEGGRAASPEELSSASATFGRVATELIGSGDCSLLDALEAAFGGDWAQEQTMRRMVTSLAADPARISTRYLLAGVEFGAVDAAPAVRPLPHFEHGARVLGGNQQVALELARQLGEAVHLERPAAGIEPDADGVTLTLRDGEVVRGDALVLATPLPAAQQLLQGVRVPDGVRAALDNRFMAVAAKLSVPIGESQPPRGVQSDEAFWWAWNSASADDSTSVPAVTAFAGGPATLESLHLKTDQQWVADLQRLRPDVKVDGPALLTDWRQDEWTQGSYSAPSVGWVPELDEALATPVGRLVLAGEYTAGPLASSMNGALNSGERAAAQLVKMTS
jgi:monoamine oxidase